MKTQIYNPKKKWSGSNWQKYFVSIYIHVVDAEFVKDSKE